MPLDMSFPALDQPHGASEPGSSKIFWVKALSKVRSPLKLRWRIWIYWITWLWSRHYLHVTLPVASFLVHVSTMDGVSGVASHVKEVLLSTKELKCEDEDGDTGTVRPYITPDLPINLWGRDIMEQMHFYLVKWKKPDVIQQMMAQGKNLQGIIEPIIPTPKNDRTGLGYFPPFSWWSLLLLHPRQTKFHGLMMIWSGWTSGLSPLKNCLQPPS